MESLGFLLVIGIPVALVLLYFRRPVDRITPSEPHGTPRDTGAFCSSGPVVGTAMDAEARAKQHEHHG